MLDLFEYFDDRFRGMARTVGAQEVLYPTLIPTEVIDRCGYVESFPQLLMLATRLRGDLADRPQLVVLAHEGGLLAPGRILPGEYARAVAGPGRCLLRADAPVSGGYEYRWCD